MNLHKTEIGARIRTQRKACNLTGEQLAERIDITPEFLRCIESGNKGMSIYTLAKLAMALNTTTDYLLFGSESEDNYTILIQLLKRCPDERIPALTHILQELLFFLDNQ
jgi:transcriptional regulator with XRE-family HTH domain